MRALLLGASGFLGPAIVTAALGRGAEVFGLSRREVPGGSPKARFLVGDRSTRGLVHELTARHRIDAVIDLLAMTHGGTERVLEQLEERTRYVLVSSSDVYRNFELLHRRAVGTATSQTIDEDSPLRTTRFPYRGAQPRAREDPERWLDDYDKIPIEEAVRTTCASWTILRLPMVYGPGDRQRRFRWAIRHCTAEAAAPLRIPHSWGRWVATHGYVADVADAIALAALHPDAEHRVYNVGEARPASQSVWARRIAGVIGWRGDIQLCDDDANPIARATQGLDLSVPLDTSSVRIREELGFRETTSLSAGLRETVADELGHPSPS